MKRYLSKADHRDIAMFFAGLIEYEDVVHLINSPLKRRRRWRRLDELEPGLRTAVEAAGGLSKLAGLLGIAPQAIAQWSVIPIKRVLDVERVTGVDRKKLRSDYFI